MKVLLAILALTVSLHGQDWNGIVATPSSTPTVKASFVTGSFVVPEMTDYSGDYYAYVWIGLGGYWDWDKTLQQIGLEIWSWQSAPWNGVWYEWLPAASKRVYDEISTDVGDTVKLTIRFSGTTCVMTADNLTTGETFEVSRKIAKAVCGSAEWIMETYPNPPAYFGTLTMFDCAAVIGGQAVGLDYPNLHRFAQDSRIGVNAPIANTFQFVRW